MSEVFDVAVIGGGINGCGCAADAALRGLSVVLFEKDDLASKTSSSSTKLIHGGLRYLENFEFSLVKKALDERQTLLTLAPHLVHPQAFILPYQKQMRPAWFLRLGLFFYDHLSRKNKLPKCKYIDRRHNHQYFAPLNDRFKRGFLFYDAATDDARLTITNALQASLQGASIRPQESVIHAQATQGIWELTIQPKHGPIYKIHAKSVINAAGPWVDAIAKMTHLPQPLQMALIKGSHIIVPKVYEGKHAFFLQHTDKRVIFVIPYHGFSMIGTTDVLFTGSLDTIQITDGEIEYLTGLANMYFKTKLTKDDVVYSWSGIRPLLAEEGKEYKSISRDYRFEMSSTPAPIITIYGGKITTYRQLAEDVINQLELVFPSLRPSQTKTAPLPGAQWGTMNFKQYTIYAMEKYGWLDMELLQRYLLSYGCCMEKFLAPCTTMQSLGKHFGASLYQVEVDYLVSTEWARECDDILIRRTKLGLTMDADSQSQLAAYLATMADRPVLADS